MKNCQSSKFVLLRELEGAARYAGFLLAPGEGFGLRPSHFVCPSGKKRFFFLIYILEGAARYAGLLLAPGEGFGLRPRPFFALRAKKDLFMSVLAKILELGDQ